MDVKRKLCLLWCCVLLSNLNWVSHAQIGLDESLAVESDAQTAASNVQNIFIIGASRSFLTNIRARASLLSDVPWKQTEALPAHNLVGVLVGYQRLYKYDNRYGLGFRFDVEYEKWRQDEGSFITVKGNIVLAVLSESVAIPYLWGGLSLPTLLDKSVWGGDEASREFNIKNIPGFGAQMGVGVRLSSAMFLELEGFVRTFAARWDVNEPYLDKEMFKIMALQKGLRVSAGLML